MVNIKMPERIKPMFSRYIGIDYSGAETPDSSLKGLRVYEANRESEPVEVEPPPSPRKYWTRRGLAEWLAKHLAEDVPTIVGIDHGFSLPLRYFEVHWLEPDWPTFLDDFQKHWPTEDSSYEEYQDDPLEKLAESVDDDGILPDHYDQMTQAELRAFERMCRRFEKYLGESK